MTEEDVGPTYCAILEELKARVDTIAEVVSAIRSPTSAQHHRHNVFLFEGLYLQLRKVCELLSLSLLLVHHITDKAWAKTLIKEWRSDRLLDEVSKINPIGFPRPISPSDWRSGSNETLAEFPPVFTATDLKSLYVECGDRLHVGSLRNVLRNRTLELNQTLIREWVTKIQVGLSSHMIVLPHICRSLLVRMEDPETKQVSCTFATILE